MDSTSIIKNVLFVNSAVLSLDTYINSETFKIGYDARTSTTDEMMQCFLSAAARDNNTINRIGFAFHYSSLILFLNQEPFFTDSDLGESVEIYSKNVQFMLDLLLIGGITHVDFLACNTLQSEQWKQYYQLLQTKTGVIIGASENNTGNLKYGGDWIMESTQEEVGLVYFTAEIENWASLLALPTGLNTYYHTFYTVQSGGTVMTRTIYNNAGATILDTRDISFGGMPIADVFSLLDGGGTNPFTIGIVDSSLSKISMDIAYCDVFTKSLTDRQKTVLMNDVNTKYKEPHTAVANTYTVTVTNNVYWISYENRPELLLNFGKMYMFDNISNLPFYTNIGRSTNYVTGVVTNSSTGILNNYTLIDISNSAPASLYYGSSAAIGGNIYVSANTVLIRTSSSTVEVGGTVTVTILSSLPAGTPILYSIEGTVTTANLSNANLLNNTFTLPMTYSVTGGGGSTIIFTSANAASVTVNINRSIASMPGLLLNLKYSAAAGEMRDVSTNATGTSTGTIGSLTTDVSGINGIRGAAGIITVFNRLSSSNVGITTFIVLKFTSFVMNDYFFEQSPNFNGSIKSGANLYTNSYGTTNITIGINNYATINGTGSPTTATNTNYIITSKHGRSSSSSTELVEELRINGTLRSYGTSTASPTFYPNGGAQQYFVFGTSNTVVVESIVFDYFLTVADISVVEMSLAATYGISYPP